MLSNVFLKALRDQRLSLLFWSVGVAALALVLCTFYPTVKATPGINEILERMPKVLAEAMSGTGILNFTTATGYLNARAFSIIAPLLFVMFTVGMGSGAIAGEEEKGTLEFLLGQPVSRRRILVQKSGMMLAALAIVALVFWAALVAGGAMTDMGIPASRLAAGTLVVVLLGLDFGALALALGCQTGNRSLSTGVSAWR